MELRQTQQLLGQCPEMALPADFNAQLTKKIHRLVKHKRISLTQIITSAAAAVLLTLAVQYFSAIADSRQLPTHFTLFHTQQEAMGQESSWTNRIIAKFFDHTSGERERR